MPELADKIFDYLHGNITLNDDDFNSLKKQIQEIIEKSEKCQRQNHEQIIIEYNARYQAIVKLESQNKSLSELFVKWNQRVIGDEEYSRSVIKLLQEKYHEIAERIDEE